MRITWHIFRKDARRLWWEIAVVLALVAAFAAIDSRAPQALTDSGVAGLGLSLLLPIGWVYLIALLVHGEALVGDRQFWITRPYSWPALLAAKALFVLVFVHVPVFMADCVIVAVRGLPLPSAIPVLLVRQALLAVAITLPASALAAITRNLTQFIAAAVVIVAAPFVAANSVALPVMAEEMRVAIALLGLAVAAVAIIWFQYSRRRTAVSRGVAVIAVVGAGSAFAYMPRTTTFALECAVSDRNAGARLSVELDTEKERFTDPAPTPPDKVKLAIPLRISGLQPSTAEQLEELEIAIAGPRGERWVTHPQPGRSWTAYIELRGVIGEFRVGSPDNGTWLFRPDTAVKQPPLGKAWQMLQLDRSFYAKLRGEPAEVRGAVAVNLYQAREAGRMPVGGAVIAAGLGHCASRVVTGDYGITNLVVDCNSISPLPSQVRARVDVVNREDGFIYPNWLNPGNNLTWLSPVWNSRAYFMVADSAIPSGIPRRMLESAEVKLTAPERVGCQLLRFELHGIKLQDYEVLR